MSAVIRSRVIVETKITLELNESEARALDGIAKIEHAGRALSTTAGAEMLERLRIAESKAACADNLAYSLKGVEWITRGDSWGGTYRVCQCCSEMEEKGHALDCCIGKALAEWEANK